MRTISGAVVFCFALASLAAAEATLAGKWQGETPNGTPIVLELTVKETALTGKLVRGGQPTTITEGKVSKNTFTFKASINDQTEAFAGELAGETLKVWLDRQGPDRAAVLKRVKD